MKTSHRKVGDPVLHRTIPDLHGPRMIFNANGIARPPPALRRALAISPADLNSSATG